MTTEIMDELTAARAFSLQIAERLFLCAEVLSIRAERKKPKRLPMNDHNDIAEKLERAGAAWRESFLTEAADVIMYLSAKVSRLKSLNDIQENVIKKQAAQLADLWIEH